MSFIIANAFLTSEIRCSRHSLSELIVRSLSGVAKFRPKLPPARIRERFKEWKLALALNPIPQFYGCFLFEDLRKRRQGEADPSGLSFLAVRH
jgi:hypothetical protein